MGFPRSIESCHHHAQNEFANSSNNMTCVRFTYHNISLNNRG